MIEFVEIPMFNTVFLDTETQKSSDEVGGWENIPDMKLSVAVTFTIADGYMRWFEDTVSGLLEYCRKFETIVTFNGERFDFKMLGAYGDTSDFYKKSFDLLLWIKERVNKRCKLEYLANETLHLVHAKTAEGLQAIQWFKEGKLKEIGDYCTEDVRILHDIIAYGKLYGFIRAYKRILPVGYQGFHIPVE